MPRVEAIDQELVQNEQQGMPGRQHEVDRM
jgi:hypothetical protein